MYKRWTLPGILCLSLVAGCHENHRNDQYVEPVFTAMGLEGRIVYRIDDIEGTLYAATDRGLYRHLSGADWQLLGERAWRIMDWARISDSHWVVSTANGHDYEEVREYAMHESFDSGMTWHSMAHDFGGDSPDVEPVRRLLANNGQLYATGTYSLAVSSDGGHHWDLLNGVWQGFGRGMSALSASPHDSQLWFGGQGAMENLLLYRYDINAGFSTEFNVSEWLPNPSTVKNIRFHPTQPERVFVAGEGGIIESRNNGEQWQPFNVNPDYRFYFDLAFDPQVASRYYTAGWSKIVDTAQPLVLEVSNDDGTHWKRYTHPDTTLYGGVYSMLARQEVRETVVYLGLFKGGVVRVSEIPE